MARCDVLAICLQVGAVVLGYGWGAYFWDVGLPPFMFRICGILAGLVMLVGAFDWAFISSTQTSKKALFVKAAVLLYSIGVIFVEPFLRISNTEDIFRSILVLIPLVLAIGSLDNSRSWISVTGATLFVVTCTA